MPAHRVPALLLVALALAAAGCSSAGEDSPSTAPPTTVADRPATERVSLAEAVARVRRELRGLRQTRLVLGSPAAPVSIIEYGNFACPPCAASHATVLPGVIERYVRTGRASLEFRGIAGPSATRARDLALSALGAAGQNSGWDFVQLAYLRSLELTSSNPETSAELAAALGLDIPSWRRDRAKPASASEIEAAANVAAVGRFSAYPVFLVRSRNRPDQTFVVVAGMSSVRELGAAIESAGAAGG